MKLNGKKLEKDSEIVLLKESKFNIPVGTTLVISHFYEDDDEYAFATKSSGGRIDTCWAWEKGEIKDLFGIENGFVTKDSGARDEFASGMVRDTQQDKPRYDLLDIPMLKRWAELMARGAVKYGENNWKKANGEEELKRFKASALRHMIQWFEGETDEDHASAVFFNISGAEMVAKKIKDGVK